ncbi:hypothetical protein D3C80_1370810 [compost metagenome]
MIPHRDELGLEGHHRLEVVIRRHSVREGGDAVEDDAGAHPVAVGVRPGQDARRVRHGTLALERRGQAAEEIDLLTGGGLLELIGAAEVGHDVERLHHVLALAEPLDKGGHLLGPHPEPVHAGVELEPGHHGGRQLGLLQGLELLPGVYRGLQVVGRQHRQIGAREEALQQHYGFDHGAGAQHQRLLDAGHRIGIRIHQGAGHRQQAMAIGVGLDHGDDLAGRRVALDHGEVVAQGRGIDLGNSRFHLFSLTRA